MARKTSKFCIFYWSNNLNYLELNLYILWFIFWSYTGCQNLTLAISITIGLISISVFEIYGLIKKSMWLVRISFILRCIQTLTALGLLIFVIIIQIDIKNEEKFAKWWKFTYGTRLILGGLLTFALIYYILKAMLQFKISGRISQEKMENLPMTSNIQEDQTTFSITGKKLNPPPDPVILKSIAQITLSIDFYPQLTSRAL